MRHVLRVALALVAVAVVLASGALAFAYREARAGEASLLSAADALRGDDPARARRALDDARSRFDRARGVLGSPLAWPVHAVPLGPRQIRAAEALATAGLHAVRTVDAFVDAAESRPPSGWKRGGGFDLEAIARAADAVAGAVPDAVRARRAVEAAPEGWLLPVLRHARDRAAEELAAAEDGARHAAAALLAVPELLGAEGLRRYLVGFANLAELRGAGGMVGQFAILEADGGRLRLVEERGRPAEDLLRPRDVDLDGPRWFFDAYARYGATSIWQNVNMPSDFPTVARLSLQLAEPAVGKLDGLLQVDPVGLAALLTLTGPIEMDGWPEPVTPDNVSAITHFEAERVYGDQEDQAQRIDFLGDVATAVFGRFLAPDTSVRAASLDALGRAVAGGHIQMAVTDPEALSALEGAGLARGVERASNATDVLGLVSQNAIGNKADWFLRRRLSYLVRFDPETRTARTTLDVALHNGAPSGGLPPRIIGSSSPAVPGNGTNRQLVVLLRDPDDTLRTVTLDGADAAVTGDREGDLLAYHRAVTMASGARSRLRVSSDVPGALRRDGDRFVYRLHVLRQPVAHPDQVSVTLEPPLGWRIDGVRAYEGELRVDLVMEVTLRRTLRGRVVEAGLLRPYRIVADRLRAVLGSEG